jgi:hypothetical protein
MAEPTLTDAATILATVEKHRPNNHAPLPADLGERLGATHYAGKYCTSDEPYLLEGIGILHGLGFKTVKLWLGRDLPGYAFNSKWDLPKDARLVDVIKHDYFKRALEAPFETFIFEIAPVGRQPTPKAGKPLTVEDFKPDQEQFAELADHLLTTYGRQPLTFILQHWEGDWMLRGKAGEKWTKDAVPADGPARVDTFAAWLTARQRGVEQARERAGKTIARVLHATEANRVLDSLVDGVPTIARDVLPKVAVDLVSWSCYDGMNSPQPAVNTWHGLEILRHYARPSPAGVKNHIYIGEVGIPENQNTPEAVEKYWDTAMAVFLANDLPWIVVWELYCNEPKAGVKVEAGKSLAADQMRGFWLVKPDGSMGVGGQYLSNILNSAGGKI